MVKTGIDGVTMTWDDRASSTGASQEVSAAGLTVLWHPDVSRVGDRLLLRDRRTAVSRLAPDFEQITGNNSGPLSDPYVSRKPITFTLRPGGIEIDPGEARASVDGVELTRPITLAAADLERGMVIGLARRVLLRLHRMPVVPDREPDPRLVGHSPPMRRLRSDIDRLAGTEATVLIRGESGSGKELVAAAVHASSKRHRGPYRTVNVAAIPATVAASAFFGHTRGAFSGADRESRGYFGESDGGTLFLDEIGELSSELQALLLRALESREIQPVGASRPRTVDVRIVAATDAKLAKAVEAGTFSLPLMHRLAQVELWIPPLRDRLDDIPRLLLFKLREELTALGALDRLEGEPQARKPWLDASLVMLLLRHRWPGNVRELFNVARQIALAGQSRSRVKAHHVPALERMAEGASVDSASNASQPPSISPPSEAPLTEARVLEALQAAGWAVHAAARALEVPKTSLYRFIEAHRLVRKASEIPDDELRAVFAEFGGDREAMSNRLRVSIRALTFRLKELDPPPGAG